MLDIPPQVEMLAACRDGDVVRVRQLLTWGVDPRVTPPRAEPYLTEACRAGHIDVAKALVRAGAVPTQRDIVLAVESGDVYLADHLADEMFFAGIDFDFWAEDRPLLCKPGFLQSTSAAMVAWMLKQGADPKQADRFGRTPVALAQADTVDPSIRELLLAAA